MLFAGRKKVSYFRTKIGRPSFLFSSHSSLLLLNFAIFNFAEMITKFNQEFYARIKAKKNEPFSCIGQHKLRVVENEKETAKKCFSTPILDEGRVASPTLSVEEIPPCHKRRKMNDKGKEKIGGSIWANVETAQARANEVVTLDDLKEISNVPSHEMANCHIHKLVRVIFFVFCLSLFFLENIN